MTISSYSQLTAAFGLGKTNQLIGQKIINTGATSVAGRWHECFAALGTGGTGVLTGTAGLGAALSSATTGAIPQTNPTVTPDIKHVTSAFANTAGTTVVPAVILLTDLLYVYPSCVVTGTPTVPNNGAAKPTRHNNGVGVQLSAFVVGALGAATPLLTVTYTNSAGTTGRVGTLVASANSLPVGAAMSGGNVATLGGPFMQLQAGDTGVREINSYVITSGATTGTVTFVLHRPVTLPIPIVAANTPGERDLVNQFPSMPIIQEDACLALLANIGGATLANQVVQYGFTTVWG